MIAQKKEKSALEAAEDVVAEAAVEVEDPRKVNERVNERAKQPGGIWYLEYRKELEAQQNAADTRAAALMNEAKRAATAEALAKLGIEFDDNIGEG